MGKQPFFQKNRHSQRHPRGFSVASHPEGASYGCRGKKWPTWQEKLPWRLLDEEARRLILTMPPVAR
jgi:hypothetical protein